MWCGYYAITVGLHAAVTDVPYAESFASPVEVLVFGALVFLYILLGFMLLTSSSESSTK